MNRGTLGIVLIGLYLWFVASPSCSAQSGWLPSARPSSAQPDVSKSENDAAFAQDANPDRLMAAISSQFPSLLDSSAKVDETGDEADLSEESAEPGPPGPGQPHHSHIGIGVKASTLGAGIEVATPLTRRLNVRGGFNMMRLDHTFTDSGIQYAGQLRFQSAEAHLDWFPLWGFHVSPGLLFYNGNQITANATVPGGQTFSVSGTTYESDPTTPVTGTGKLDFVKVAPSLMRGVGNLIPRSGRHYSFLFEVGAAYEGSARVSLNLTGNVCDTSGSVCRAISSDPTVQANVQGQQTKIQHDVNPYRFFSVVSLGVGFNF